LGCGGWGCAYLCTNGKEKAVFKTPKGFEKIIEESWEPPTPLSSHLVNILMEVRSEAENVSKLNHQNIIKLLDYSKNDSLPLLIYEYADYGTLYWQLSNGWKPSMRDVLLIGIQPGDALRYIHSRGLIHGDINPSNIFIKGGIIKLGDFSSIVKLLSSVSRSEMPGRPGFRAPEQVFSDIMKKARELGVENRIDVYQLANTLLFLLTGESIDGKDAADEKLVKEKLNKVPNKELRKILAEALDPEPSKRPSAEEFTKKLYTIYTIYTKTTKELKEELGNSEREINRYERIGKILLEEKGDKILGIIGKYLKTSSDYDENAQKIIEALDYDEEDLIAAYKLGRELGYSREQLKNIAAAIALKNYRAWELTNEDKLINIGEDPKGIKMYIAETAAKTSRKDLKERIIKEIFK
jgi:serine/threonine protein kinase